MESDGQQLNESQTDPSENGEAGFDLQGRG
jgi:hypothetical protein